MATFSGQEVPPETQQVLFKSLCTGMANSLDVLFRFVLQVSLPIENFTRWLEVVIPALMRSSSTGDSYEAEPRAVLRGSDTAGRVVDVLWSFKRGNQKTLGWILSNINESAKAADLPPVVVAFCLGADSGSFRLWFGLLRLRDLEGPGAETSFSLFSKEPLLRPTLTQQFYDELVWYTMKGPLEVSLCTEHRRRKRALKELLESGGSCAACEFVAALEDPYSFLQEEDFVTEMELWLPGWRDPYGKRLKWLSTLLGRSGHLPFAFIAEKVASFVFPQGHPLHPVQVDDLTALNLPTLDSESE
ncbi:unnamed protein product [Symbiodinium natans]|uniref:Uncharacterized protein n=1 Tax=Symbiodinium natans TaxID=878477 RepID=A0A812KGE0_9DINO|nr:unnamed protein product [Symbiodinium natans]